jgi:DUF1009 family protein
MSGWRKIGIIAGGGNLPVKLAEICAATKQPFYVVRLPGADIAALSVFAGADSGLGEVGKIFRLLKENDCDAVVMAGIVKRPDFSTLAVDWRGAMLLPKIIAGAAQGDGGLLDVLVSALEAEGLAVIGADDIARGLSFPAGALGEYAPQDQHLADMRKAAAVVAALGPFDVGQGAVIANGLVLAIEAAEGTDAMLQRCASLPRALLGKEKSGVLLKRPKPGQELRVDLPTVGVETVRAVIAAGLGGVAVEAGRALLLDADDAVAAADAAGVFLYGFDASELGPS